MESATRIRNTSIRDRRTCSLFCLDRQSEAYCTGIKLVLRLEDESKVGAKVFLFVEQQNVKLSACFVGVGFFDNGTVGFVRFWWSSKHHKFSAHAHCATSTKTNLHLHLQKKT